jgi:hypothetical protein
VVLLGAMAESIALGWKLTIAGKNRRTGKPARWIDGEPGPPYSCDFSHIYLHLGWPALAPKQWASAEGTVPGVPLGYDVAVDGPPAGMGSRADFAGWSGYGVLPASETVAVVTTAPKTPESAAIVVEQPPQEIRQLSTIERALVKVEWSDVITNIVQGVIVALILEAVLSRGRGRA